MFGFRRDNSNRAMSVKSAKGEGCGRIFLVLFFGLFFAVGSFMLYKFAIEPLWGVYAASRWKPTPCTIVSSKLEEHQGDDSTTYRIDIRFDYEFGGRKYQSDRYRFFDVASNTGVASKRAAVRQHPPGKKTTCFVDPANPSEAVIERGLTWDMLWGLFALPFFIVGAGGLLFTLGIVKWKSKPPGQAEWMPTVKHRRQQSDWQAVLDDDAGPITLKPKMGPVGKLVMMLLIAAFWNGIVSVLIYKTVQSVAAGRTEWMLIIFSVIFGGVGLLLIGLAIHAFLGLFTPRPTVTVNSARVTLGDTLDLAWQFRGQTTSIRQLRIYLEGQEKATYRRGTNTYTDTETFSTLTLIDTTDPFEMGSGETQLSLPADTMHSLEADHNEIIWTLHIKGDIARWPDVADEYALLVVPPGIGTEIDPNNAS